MAVPVTIMMRIFCDMSHLLTSSKHPCHSCVSHTAELQLCPDLAESVVSSELERDRLTGRPVLRLGLEPGLIGLEWNVLISSQLSSPS